MEAETLIVTAYAKAPQNTAMYENNKHMGIVLEIDKKTHKIVDVEVTVMTEIVKNYFRKKMVGMNFKESIDSFIEDIKENYHAPSQNSMIVAVKIAHQRYHDNCLTKKNKYKSPFMNY